MSRPRIKYPPRSRQSARLVEKSQAPVATQSKRIELRGRTVVVPEQSRPAPRRQQTSLITPQKSFPQEDLSRLRRDPLPLTSGEAEIEKTQQLRDLPTAEQLPGQVTDHVSPNQGDHSPEKAAQKVQGKPILPPSTSPAPESSPPTKFLDPNRFFFIARLGWPSPSLSDDMPHDSSASASASSNRQSADEARVDGARTDGQSTARPGKKRKDPSDPESRILDPPRLLGHNITLTPEADDRMDEWRTLLDVRLPSWKTEDVNAIKKYAEDFIKELNNPRAADTMLESVDGLRLLIDERKQLLGFPIISEASFQTLVSDCLRANEAVLQRSLMMSIFDPSRIPPEIAWYCEGVWTEHQDCAFPALTPGKLTLPRPDLVFSFKQAAFVGTKPVPSVPDILSACLSPDRNEDNTRTRYFPFLFLEAKRSDSATSEAYQNNLNTASRALFHIHKWMSTAGKATDFFKSVRVFSIALNARNFNVRIHRAQWDQSENQLAYFYDDKLLAPVVTDVSITKDRLCRLIHGILKSYAVDVLLPLLRTAYNDICNRTSNYHREQRAARERETEQKIAAQLGFIGLPQDSNLVSSQLKANLNSQVNPHLSTQVDVEATTQVDEMAIENEQGSEQPIEPTNDQGPSKRQKVPRKSQGKQKKAHAPSPSSTETTFDLGRVNLG